MSKLIRYALYCGCLLAAVLPAAAEELKLPVYVSCSMEPGDMTGQTICSHLRDEIASSPRYKLVAASDFHWEVHLISVSTIAHASAMSMALTMEADTGSFYFTSYVYLIPDADRDSFHHTIYADMDEHVTKFVQDYQARHKDAGVTQ